MTTLGDTPQDPIPVDVDRVVFIDDEYEPHLVREYEAPLPDDAPNRTLFLTEGSMPYEVLERIWGKWVVDGRGDIWRVRMWSASLEHTDIGLSVEKWFPDYIYEKIKCDKCNAPATRISRSENGLRSYCPMIGWDGVSHRCSQPKAPKPPVCAPAGSVSIDMSETIKSLNQFHRECKAYADWFGFLDPNPIKWEKLEANDQ